MTEKLAPTKRHQYHYNGRLVYEWTQSYSEVNICIPLPTGCNPPKDLYCEIDSTHLKIGIRPHKPYLDEDLSQRVIVSESVWTIEDNELNVSLQKAQEGESWSCALKGHQMAEEDVENDKKRLLLERFQLEHAGFDFSNAEVTGSAPNPRTFLKEDKES